ncbi:acyl-CoA carboxylase subunit epsilon [Pseudonocardia sp. CA-107938]|uniref:acyl-CoA carboxylase subunit epsilon n=1 Tax=Pseudonocardia sp. CA-107938 TaxID=3240021 RepID=UPI003D9329FE
MSLEEATPEERRALFRVVRGGPSDEELAAVAVVLAAAASASGEEPAAAAPDRWSDPSVQHRVPLVPGPGAWRTTYWPR